MEIPIGSPIKILHFNIEKLSKQKCDLLARIAYDENVDLLLLQETATKNDEDIARRGIIEGFDLAAVLHSSTYGIASYIRRRIVDFSVTFCGIQHDTFIIAVNVQGINIINVYKPPCTLWTPESLGQFSHPAVYSGDFNSHSTMWGYKKNDHNGDILQDWISKHGYELVFDAKDKNTFHSAAWNSESNPDLCFVSESIAGNNGVKRKVLHDFPHSQHRPVMVTLGYSINTVPSHKVPRWNFQKASWENFTAEMEHVINFIPPKVDNYDRFTKLTNSIAKKHIPRGFRTTYIPGWNEECEKLYKEFKVSNDFNVGISLLDALNEQRKKKWRQKTEQLNFARSSRTAWSLLRKLGSANSLKSCKTNIKPDLIASRMLECSSASLSKNRLRNMKRKVRKLKATLQNNDAYSSAFSDDDLDFAISQMKLGKAAGLDNMYMEFIKYFGPKVRNWLLQLFNSMLVTGKIPSIFKKSKVLAIIKPNKNGYNASDYRPITLLCIPYKILEKMLLMRLKSYFEEQFPIEQAGFREGRSCHDQVLALTTLIENGFQRQSKSFMASIDLSAAYDSVWRDGLLFKFMKAFPCKRLANLLNNMLNNRYFRVHLNNETSRWKRLNNGIPQGSVLAPALFNLYISDQPITIAQKFQYADDETLLFQGKDFKSGEEVLSKDLTTLFHYFKLWRLKPNAAKTEVSVFHLNNKEAAREIDVIVDGHRLAFNNTPKYLGLYLDRTLTFKHHLEKLSQKVRTRGNLIQKLAGSNWGADAITLRISALSIVYAAAEYCCSVWSRSSHTHLIDTQLNQVMRIITGCVSSTPLSWLPVLSNIAPPEVRRDAITSQLIKKTYLLDNSLLSEILKDLPENRLKSRSPVHQHLSELLNFDLKVNWKALWEAARVTNMELIIDPTMSIDGFDLPRKVWVTLNRIRTGHGKCNHCLARWGLLPSAVCDCGGTDQTMDHIVTSCPLRRFSGTLEELSEAKSRRAIDWLTNLDISL